VHIRTAPDSGGLLLDLKPSFLDAFMARAGALRHLATRRQAPAVKPVHEAISNLAGDATKSKKVFQHNGRLIPAVRMNDWSLNACKCYDSNVSDDEIQLRALMTL
jgi:hypothetical protein